VQPNHVTRITALVVALGLLQTPGLSTTGWAQRGESPKLKIQAPEQPPAKPEPGQTPPAQALPENRECIDGRSGFRSKGKASAFVIELTNSCEQRFRCTVNAYVVNAFGTARGRAVLTLAPKSKGEAAHKSYAIKVKSAGGMANVSRTCKKI
jgi:hypothetical protein